MNEMPMEDPEIASIARKVDEAISKAREMADAPARPPMPLRSATMDATRTADMMHKRVRLQVESIVTMAVMTWLREVRGSSPFIGPRDQHIMNTVKEQIFSIEADNHDFTMRDAG